jgi:hypothetical protein
MAPCDVARSRDAPPVSLAEQEWQYPAVLVRPIADTARIARPSGE